MANLMTGSTGPEVRDLQTQLNAKFRPTPLLAVDGIFDPKTNAVVRGFQTKSMLMADGIVGPKTRAALAAAPNVGRVAGGWTERSEGSPGSRARECSFQFGSSGWKTLVAKPRRTSPSAQSPDDP